MTYDEMKKGIMGELKKVFRPEFLNRIDEVIVFHKLAKTEVREIVELLMKRVRESLAERELSLNLSEDAADLLVEKGWDPSMGARPLRRAIQRYIEDPLADEVLAQNAEPGSTVEVYRVDRDQDDKDSEDEVKDLDHQAAQARGGQRRRRSPGVIGATPRTPPSDRGLRSPPRTCRRTPTCCPTCLTPRPPPGPRTKHRGTGSPGRGGNALTAGSAASGTGGGGRARTRPRKVQGLPLSPGSLTRVRFASPRKRT